MDWKCTLSIADEKRVVAANDMFYEKMRISLSFMPFKILYDVVNVVLFRKTRNHLNVSLMKGLGLCI